MEALSGSGRQSLSEQECHWGFTELFLWLGMWKWVCVRALSHSSMGSQAGGYWFDGRKSNQCLAAGPSLLVVGGRGVGEPQKNNMAALPEKGWPFRRWILAPTSMKTTVLALAEEKLRFLEMCISTFVTVLSAKRTGSQRARDGSCYLWRNALLVKHEKCFRNEFLAMVWKQMLNFFF